MAGYPFQAPGSCLQLHPLFGPHRPARVRRRRHASGPGRSRRLPVQREVDPATLMEGALDGVDRFLDPRAVVEVPLVARAALDDLVDEVTHEIRVEERRPVLWRVSTGRVEASGDLELPELDVVRRRDADRLRHALLLDEATDDRPAAAVEAGLDPRVVADGDEAGLDRADGAVRVLADVD